jgi:hypothetical protein
MNKTAQVLTRDKVITHVTAQHYNIGCVRKEVSVLRNNGWKINTKRAKDLNGKSYTRWELID